MFLIENVKHVHSKQMENIIKYDALLQIKLPTIDKAVKISFTTTSYNIKTQLKSILTTQQYHI